MGKLPKRLKTEPLIEVIWQAQFEDNQGIGDVLPGILFSELKKSHPELQLRRLPTANIPAEITQMDPSLRYVAKMFMEESGKPFIWQVGERVIALNCRKPYVGWNMFKEAVLALTRIVEGSGLIPNPLRHSLRYIDLLKNEVFADLSALKLQMRLGDHEIRDRVRMRVEIPDAECLHVLQIATAAKANPAGEQITGSIIDLETLPAGMPGNWNELRAQLDLLHDRCKAVFFQQILTEETIQELEPEY
ncbi:MAG TPA: TIGR04255 family protein [Burkholderiaceae bacterium]|nr:TIGR04255 family protein [Burkholderiaceae bacterium]